MMTRRAKILGYSILILSITAVYALGFWKWLAISSFFMVAKHEAELNKRRIEKTNGCCKKKVQKFH